MTKLIEVPLDRLDDGTNVRAKVDVGLRASILEYGVLQPITVARGRGGRYTVLYGHRRTAAARAAGLTAIPAVVEPDPDDLELRQLVENQQRRAVDSIDVARSIKRYLDHHPGATQADVARKLGRSGYYVSTKLALLGLDAVTQQRVASGELSDHRAYAGIKATSVQRTGRPRTLTLPSEESRSASVVVPLSNSVGSVGKSGRKAQATLGVERGSAHVDLLLEDGDGHGIMLSISPASARLLGLRLTQAATAAAAGIPA